MCPSGVISRLPGEPFTEATLPPRPARGSTKADIAVGFATRSGVERIQDHLSDFLAGSGRLRLVTGDYLAG